jgi:hypothetical protein
MECVDGPMKHVNWEEWRAIANARPPINGGEPRAVIRIKAVRQRLGETRHFKTSLDTLNLRPRDLARGPVTQQAFLRAPETSITG